MSVRSPYSHVDELRLTAHQHVLLMDELEPVHQQAVLGAVCQSNQAEKEFRYVPQGFLPTQRSRPRQALPRWGGRDSLIINLTSSSS